MSHLHQSAPPRQIEITQALCVTLAVGLLEMCREMEPNKKTAKSNRLGSSIEQIMRRTAPYCPGVCDPAVDEIAHKTFDEIVQTIERGSQAVLTAGATP